MKNYKIGNCCKKCGERGAKSKYWNGMPDIEVCDMFGGIPDDFEPEERIVRTCNNCEYVWHDLPIIIT